MRKFLRLLAVLGGGACLAALMAAPALAGSISAPTGSPFTWPSDAAGTPLYQDVSFTGFPAGVNVYVELCDAADPSQPTWDPTEHCDLATSKSPIQGPSGTFQASDINHQFRPFHGEGGQGLFSCWGPNEAIPAGATNPTRHCKVRVASSLQTPTLDQAFLEINVADGAGADVPEVPYAVVLPIGAAVIGGAFLIIRRRRAAHAA